MSTSNGKSPPSCSNISLLFNHWKDINISSYLHCSTTVVQGWKHGITGADPGFFLGGGALVSCSTSTPINHIVFFCRIPVVLENRRSSRGWGRGVRTPCTLPLDPPLYKCSGDRDFSTLTMWFLFLGKREAPILLARYPCVVVAKRFDWVLGTRIQQCTGLVLGDMFLVHDLAGHGVLAQTSEHPNDVWLIIH